MECFRELVAALVGLAEADPSRFVDELATTADHVSSWPAELRLGGAHFVSDAMDGRIPEGVVGLLGGLRLFDVVVDRETRRPLCWESAKERVEQLTRWLRGLPDDGIDLRVLDLSPNAWLRHAPVREYDLPDLHFPRNEAFWDALASCGALRRLERLDLSFGHIELSPTEVRAYEIINDARYFDVPRDFAVVAWLQKAAFRDCLVDLSCCGMAPMHARASEHELALPSLRRLDLSGAPRREATHWIRQLELPSLECLVLGSDVITDFAMSAHWEDLDLEDQQVLQHDWCVSSQRDLEGLPFSSEELHDLVARAERLERLELGGEDFEPARSIEVVHVETGSYPVAIPW